jgi:hypothetical protein
VRAFRGVHLTLPDETLIPQPLLPGREKGSKRNSKSLSLFGKGIEGKDFQREMRPSQRVWVVNLGFLPRKNSPPTTPTLEIEDLNP